MFFFLIGICLTLAGLSLATSLGLLTGILVNGRLSSSIPTLSMAAMPVVLVTTLSRMGHRAAGSIDIREWKLVAASGLVLTLISMFLQGRRMVALLRSRSALLSAAGGGIALLPFALLVNGNPYSYHYLGNGEYLNYARLAAAMLDYHGTLDGMLAHHRELRYGQDILLATDSAIFGRHPIEMVHIVSGYLLFCYGAMLGLILAESLASTPVVLCLLAFHFSSMLPLFNADASFFSSMVILPSALGLLAWSATRAPLLDTRPGAARANWITLLPEIGLLLPLCAFITLCYPEFGIPVIATAAALACIRSWTMGTPTRSLAALGAAVAIFIVIDPGPTRNAVHVFAEQLHSGGGWNMFGDPRVEPDRFVLSLLGLSLPLLHHHPALPIVLVWGIALVWLLTLGLAIRRCTAGGAIFAPAILVWSAAGAIVLVLPLVVGGHWYASVKFFTQFSIGFVLIVATALSANGEPCRGNASRGAVLFLMLAVLAQGTIAAGEIAIGRQETSNLTFDAWREVIEAQGNTLPLVLFKEGDGEVVWFTELLADASGFVLHPLDLTQSSRLGRSGPPQAGACGTREAGQRPYDFNIPARLPSRFLAIVDRDALPGPVKSSRGFSVGVQARESVGKMDSFRVDRVATGTPQSFMPPDGTWTVDGTWSACLPAPAGDIALEFDVPAALIAGGPVDVTVQSGNRQRTISVTQAGHAQISVTSDAAVGTPVVVALSTSKNWVPQQQDPRSSDVRALGVLVRSLTIP